VVPNSKSYYREDERGEKGREEIRRIMQGERATVKKKGRPCGRDLYSMKPIHLGGAGAGVLGGRVFCLRQLCKKAQRATFLSLWTKEIKGRARTRGKRVQWKSKGSESTKGLRTVGGD